MTSSGKKTGQINLKDLPKKFIHVQKLKNTIYFSTLEIAQLNRKAQDALADVIVSSGRVMQRLIVDIRGSIGCLYKLSEALSSLDMILALAQVSMRDGYVKPSISKNTLHIKDARHPILDNMEGKDAISNDIFADPRSTFHVVTGANMAGKSTYLRQTALTQIMAQIGCFVPAAHATIKIVESVYSRVSTGDCLEANLSTFALEMREMSMILNGANSKSLVIIDELGRGE